MLQHVATGSKQTLTEHESDDRKGDTVTSLPVTNGKDMALQGQT